MKKDRKVRVKKGLMQAFPPLFTGVQTNVGTVQATTWESGVEIFLIELDCGTIKKIPVIFVNLITPN